MKTKYASTELEKDEIQIMLHNETEGAASCSLHDEKKLWMWPLRRDEEVYGNLEVREENEILEKKTYFAPTPSVGNNLGSQADIIYLICDFCS